MLYPAEAAAVANCGKQDIVFALRTERTFVQRGGSGYGTWAGIAFPDRGFGCANDLRADSFTEAGR